MFVCALVLLMYVCVCLNVESLLLDVELFGFYEMVGLAHQFYSSTERACLQVNLTHPMIVCLQRYHIFE